MELPTELAAAVERLVAEIPTRELSRATRGLSQRYRGGGETRQFVQSSADVASYLAYRVPATYAASFAAMSAAAHALPEWRPRSFLDVGAGPGTAAWAASAVWPEIEDLTLLERDERMIGVGKTLADEAGIDPLRKARWVEGDITQTSQPRSADLVVAAYAVGELQPDLLSEYIERLWDAACGIFLLIEPGTPSGFARVRAARTRLIELGGSVAAPCPYEGECPMTGSNWCHFSQRVARSRLHRAVKSGSLSYEDEKFSYCAASRLPVPTRGNRVLRHPRVRPGRIDLELCTPAGLEHRVVTRHDARTWREARHLGWGDTLRDEEESSRDEP
ncbi:MAG TPA: small ribosomal subunit Rsm22 family protein [Chloroflexota bacterium]